MNSALSGYSNEMGIILLTNTILIVILIIVTLINVVKLRKFSKSYGKFMKAGFNEKNLEQLIDACIYKTQDVVEQNRDIQNSINKIESNMLKCVQKVGFIRYAAFDDVGSDQSFSIALLDNIDNGLVISGISTREHSSVFAKSIEGGKSKYTLSAEEIQAIDRAKKAFIERR
jgi:hypothetical protein